MHFRRSLAACRPWISPASALLIAAVAPLHASHAAAEPAAATPRVAAVEAEPATQAALAAPPTAPTSTAESTSSTAAAGEEADTSDDPATDSEADSSGDDGETEARAATAANACDAPRFTADLSDAELERRFVSDLPTLGSISVGFADAGRVINGVQLAPGDAWLVVEPAYAFGTEETLDAVITAANAVREKFPDAPALRVNHIGKSDGGYIKPHKSHQSGRDVDLGFYYKDGVDYTSIRGRRAKLIETAENWELVRALILHTDVQVILVDWRIVKVLYDYALAQGEDKAWIESIFDAGGNSLVQHARRHRDHFHVRFYNPRAQELGRRVQPLLAKRPDENIAMYRVRPRDTLGHIAAQYGSTVGLIQKANHMRGTLLSIGRTLAVPLRGPCTHCPLPPVVVVPPRRLPPALSAVTAVGTVAVVTPTARATTAPAASATSASATTGPAGSGATAQIEAAAAPAGD